ncbi:PKS-NRPS hybrid synthetase cheA-like [Tasmannia lanceolata]|uniref:PKS-NRPS hybrid synthetase cheA-like n=1 Tax=Tasmannia lanceolata TaxID=3420 RepID=UPI0040641835
MPLFDVVGMTSFGSSFYSCFAFLSKEETEDYVWALKMLHDMLGGVSQQIVFVTDRELALMKAIYVVFPRAINLLCVWHIDKNILSKCKRHFEDGDNWEKFLSGWSTLINSPTEDAYVEAWKEFRDKFKEKVIAINYISDTWLPYKECFVKAWTEKHLHFGNRVTSRVEGAHSQLKKYLQLSTSDFYLVKRKLCLAIENQFQEIKTQLSAEKIKVPYKLHMAFFRELINHVSIFALDKLFQQFELATTCSTLATCKNHFTATMGLPCAHKIRYLLDERKVLFPSDVHSQWRIDDQAIDDMNCVKNSREEQMEKIIGNLQDKYRKWPSSQQEIVLNQLSQVVNSSTPMLHEPNVQNPRGRPPTSKSRKTISSTRRDPSSFEIVEATRRCSICKGVGHNSRTCPRQTVGTVSTTYFSMPIPIGVETEIGISELSTFPSETIGFGDD